MSRDKSDGHRSVAGPAAVVRRRLLLLLDTAIRQKLTTVVAPTGYGKTVLVSQWAQSQPDPMVAWISLTRADDEPAILAEHLTAALGGRAPAGPGRCSSLLDGEFLGWLGHLHPACLVLDDFQELTDSGCRDELASVVEHAPKGLRVVLVSQVDPPSSFYRLSLSDAVVELRQSDLSFTAEETQQFVSRLAGQHLTVAQAEALVDRTEGWAAGLQLAALSIRGCSDVGEFLERFATDDRSVGEYLTENVLDRQDDRLRDFLLRTSVLDQMTGSLCDEVTGATGSQALLEDLARKSVFTTAVDPMPRWFRYHKLFRATLRSHLRDRYGGMEHDLLVTAARWHLARQDVDAAVRYLTEAGEWKEVILAASHVGADMLARGRGAAVAEWIDLAPDGIRSTSVDAMLLEAAGWAVSGSGGRARAVLDVLDRSAGATRQERAIGDLFRSYAALRGGRAGEAVRTAERVLVLADDYDGAGMPDVMGLTPDHEEVVAAASTIRGTALMYAGRPEEARRSLEAAGSARHPMWQMLGTGSLSTIEAWSGRLSAAERLGRRTMGLLFHWPSGSDHSALTATVGLAVVARERDDLERAAALLRDARRLGQLSGDHLALAVVSVEQALLELALGRISIGLTELRTHRSVTHDPLPGALTARRLAAEAQLLIMAGETAGAGRALAMVPEDHYEVASARVLLAIEAGDLHGARRLLQVWPSGPQPRAGLERLLWLAVVEHLGGDEPRALGTLASVVDAAAPEGSIGMFRRHHVVATARALYREAPDPFLRAISDRPVVTPASRNVRGMVEQLTDREYMVLPLLPTRLTNVEIAQILGVSLNTVKTHLKHIYRKLGVTERSGAIQAAERLHLW